MNDRSEEEIPKEVQDKFDMGEEGYFYSHVAKWNILQDKICTQDVEEEFMNEITQNDEALLMILS